VFFEEGRELIFVEVRHGAEAGALVVEIEVHVVLHVHQFLFLFLADCRHDCGIFGSLKAHHFLDFG